MISFAASFGHAILLSGQFIYELLAWVTGAERRQQRRADEAERQLVHKQATPVVASSDFSGYEPATIFSFRVTDRGGVTVGMLKFWFNQETRVFCRDFTFANRVVLDAFGARNIPLHPVKLVRGDTVAALREASLRDIERILQKRLASECGDFKPVVVAPVAALPAPAPAGDAPPALAQAPAALATAEPKDERRPAETPTSVRSKGARIRSQDEGILLGYGFGTRTLRDDGLGREIQQFYVDLRLTGGDAHGVVKRIWGADLERALEEGHVRRDMLVNVAFLGRTKVDGGPEEKPAFKNLYQVTQIGGRK
ncbi:MAG: hypothetical protein ACREJ4_08090 [Candidatus Methylomirabilaceae bacterium]